MVSVMPAVREGGEDKVKGFGTTHREIKGHKYKYLVYWDKIEKKTDTEIFGSAYCNKLQYFNTIKLPHNVLDFFSTQLMRNSPLLYILNLIIFLQKAFKYNHFYRMCYFQE